MQSNYLQGVMWSILVCLFSALNDVATKFLGQRLSPSFVVFGRFFLSTLMLLPLMSSKGLKGLRTVNIYIHILRSVLLFAAIAPWCYGLTMLPITLATTISFSTPIFVLVLAKIFLKEHVGKERTLATILGFIGIVISINPCITCWNPMVFALILSTIMFATLDVLNKKLIQKDEPFWLMIFYSSLGTALLASIALLFQPDAWLWPTHQEWLVLSYLGFGANAILYCLIKAFSVYEISALQPFRYVELIIAASLSWVVFSEIPSMPTLLGAACIVPAALYITYIEMRNKKSSPNNAPQKKPYT